jgi:hypothetical protein
MFVVLMTRQKLDMIRKHEECSCINIFIIHMGWVKQALVTLLAIKGEAILLQAWTGPEGSRRLRVPDLKTVGT